MNKKRMWVLCPLCGAKTRLQLLAETELKSFPLYCPKCRRETVIDARGFRVVRASRIKPTAS